MKKCKSCGVPSRNKPYEGYMNPYNVEHCNVCALILNMVDIVEVQLNRPNLAGQTRKVKLTAHISK